MTENPYIPPNAAEPGGVEKRRGASRALLTRLTGVFGFVFGLGSWFIFLRLPSMHPAVSGADLASMLLVMFILSAGCVLLSIVLVVQSWLVRRWLHLLYALPTFSFVAYLAVEIIKTME